MKAIVKTKNEAGIDILDVDVPEVRDTDILVKVAAGSLCGSDLHYYHWLPGSEILCLPVILGHEFSGEVVEIGAAVRNAKVGDRVCAPPTMPCGRCPNCRVGRGDICTDRLTAGIKSDGFFAEYGRLTAGASIFKIPDNVSLEAAALMEPLMVALNAIDISAFELGSKTAILGPGPIGLLTLLLLRAGGASAITVTGTTADGMRLALARQLGADATLDVTREDPVTQTKDLTGGGFDIVFEATGNRRAILQALEMIKPGGQVVLIGIHSQLVEFDPTPMVRSRKSIISAYGYSDQQWSRGISLLASGRLDVEPIVTHRLPLERADEGFQLAIKQEAAKVLFLP
jgi:2-desacetyl-2-hydroxyethyl bacteriochlorophyllide A dehydrogenase